MRGPGASGYPGVSLHKPSNLWRAYVWVTVAFKTMRQVYIGYFYTAKEASEARTEFLATGEAATRIGNGGPGKTRNRCSSCTKTVKWCACSTPEFEVRL